MNPTLPSPLRWSLVALLATAGAVVVPSCLSNDNPHDDDDPSFPLVGRHDAIPCETCHGDGAFGPLPTACESCHADDVPPEHYEGSCGDAGCHTPVGWKATGGVGIGDDDDDVPTGDDDDDDVTNPGDDDDDVITTGDDDDDVTTGNDHEFLPLVGPHDVLCTECHADLGNITERLVCQDCHDDDRDGADHYVGQDCAHCHPVSAGWADYDEHRFTLPHPDPAPGAVNDGCVNDPAPVPVETCISCHPDPTRRDNGNATCTSCHNQPDTDCRHANGTFPGYVYADQNCKVCHPDGQG